MRKSTAALSLVIAGLAVWIYFLIRPQQALVFPNANSRDTYFTIHNLRAAHDISRGRNAKVGILDQYFGSQLAQTRGLYAGGASFGGSGDGALTTQIGHGYWMALTLREIAPEADLYPLNAVAGDEEAKLEAMVQAIDWAIGKRLDALTYSGRSFSPGSRARLDAAVDRAVAAGVVVVFIHYSHQGNLLPGALLTREKDEREADVGIYPYDYTVAFADKYLKWQRNPADSDGYRPFVSVSSTAPVTAGVVALMRSLHPGLSPAACKQVLIDTSRTMDYRGQRLTRVLDAGAAVLLARGHAADGGVMH